MYRRGVERTLGAQRTRKRPATLCGTQAVQVGMQPGTPAGQPAVRIGDQGPVGRYHTQQSGGRRCDAATHTRSHRSMELLIMFLRPCADRPTTTDHLRV